MRCRATTGNVRGFTLIEMLVVLLIMGLLAGLVSVIARPDDRALLRVEAERLAQLLDLAATESRLTGRSIAWTADASGYRFWRLTGDVEWSEVRDTDLLRMRMLPSGIAITSLEVETVRAQDTPRLEFTPYGPAYSYTIELSLGATRYTVAASPIGEVRVLPGDGIPNDELALR